jgi:arylsulfatase A-like enzyme
MVASMKQRKVFNDTLFFYTADNGAHCVESPDSVACGGINVGRSTGGVRGCKASTWEGGIRVPGFLVWPEMIKTHRETWVPAVTHDFLPTIMEALVRNTPFSRHSILRHTTSYQDRLGTNLGKS